MDEIEISMLYPCHWCWIGHLVQIVHGAALLTLRKSNILPQPINGKDTFKFLLGLM